MNLSMKIRLRVLRFFVWSVLLYGWEAWTLDKTLKRRILAVKIWFGRRTLRLPWTARITNESVIEIAGLKSELKNVERERQLEFLGNLLRHAYIEKEVFLGKMEGRRAWERQRITIDASLIEDIPGSATVVGLVRLVQNQYQSLIRFPTKSSWFKNQEIFDWSFGFLK